MPAFNFKGLIANFAPLLVYYGVLHFFGLRIAAVSTIVFCLAEAAHYRWKQRPMPKLFKFICVLTLIFGVLDIIFAEGYFVRLEPVISNLLTAGFFAYTIWSPQAIIQMIATQGGQTSSLDSPDKRFLFRVLTGIWVVYFGVKALIYLRFNLDNSIEDGLLFRAVAGNLSFLLMFVFSVVLARPLGRLLHRLRLLPSQRV